MSPDLQELEAKLRGLRPEALDSELLARLADSATGDLSTLTPAAAQFEASLRHHRPTPLPPALTAALTAALEQSAATPTIIPFPAAAKPAARASQWNRPMLAAAAAVAILGASAALFMPQQGSSPTPMAANKTAPHAVPSPLPTPPATASNLVPAAFNSGVSQASDEGVIWQDANQPRRVVKVTYWDRVTLVDPDGRKVEVEKPRVEYILVPEKID